MGYTTYYNGTLTVTVRGEPAVEGNLMFIARTLEDVAGLYHDHLDDDGIVFSGEGGYFNDFEENLKHALNKIIRSQLLINGTLYMNGDQDGDLWEVHFIDTVAHIARAADPIIICTTCEPTPSKDVCGVCGWNRDGSEAFARPPLKKRCGHVYHPKPATYVCQYCHGHGVVCNHSDHGEDDTERCQTPSHARELCGACNGSGVPDES